MEQTTNCANTLFILTFVIADLNAPRASPKESKMVQKRKTLAVANAPVKKRKQTPAAKSSKSSKPKRVVDANSLAWKSVDLPEMFNDAEGFFGLEEISGVDVVRNGNVVKFVSDLLCYFCYLISQGH